MNNADRQRFVVGVAGEVAIVQHLHPNVSLILVGYQINKKSSLEHCPRAAGLEPLVFKVKLKRLSDQFECKLKALDCGITHNIGLWKELDGLEISDVDLNPEN